MNYEILDRKPARGFGVAPCDPEIILCQLFDNQVTPWATWYYCWTPSTGRMERERGCYFRSHEEAIEDFNKRL